MNQSECIDGVGQQAIELQDCVQLYQDHIIQQKQDALASNGVDGQEKSLWLKIQSECKE